MGRKNLHGSDQNFARDLIIDANFGNDWLRGFSVAMGQILGFSIGFRRRPLKLSDGQI